MKDELFIKQCEKAEELQKGHVPLDDNYYLVHESFIYGKCHESVYHYCESCYEEGTAHKPNMSAVCTNDHSNKTYIWLPTQVQLQKMLDWNSYQLTAEFAKYVHYRAGFEGDCPSMESLWLAFVMKEKYRKIWDGETWIKEG